MYYRILTCWGPIVVWSIYNNFSCSGYEELTAGPAGVDYTKGYNSNSQAQVKSAAAGPGKGKDYHLLLHTIIILLQRQLENLLLMCFQGSQ